MVLDMSLLHPSSVCIVGASADPRRLAGRPLVRLTQHGFAGRIHLVNPKHTSIDGRPCYPTIADVPESVDIALVVLPARQVPTVVEECGRKGIKNVVVLSSGFEEDEQGGMLVERLRSAARRHDITIIGPNCEGIWAVPARMALTFGSAANRESLVAGGVSVISQSGSIGGACMRELQDRGVGVRYFVSSGNETTTTAMDLLDLLITEGNSRVLAMFVEGLTDGWRLRGLAERAKLAGIRLIALRGGVSARGRLASLSHTGKVASGARVYLELFRQADVVDVQSFTHLVDAIELAARDPELPSMGRDTGLGVIAISGGSRALLADACHRLGVPLADFAEETEDELARVLPRFGSATNPTDVTGEVLSDPDLFGRTAEIVTSDTHTDMVLVQYANGAGPQVERHLEEIKALRVTYGKPFLLSFLGSVPSELRAKLSEHRLDVADDPEAAITRVGWLRQFARTPTGHVDVDDGVGFPGAGEMFAPNDATWDDACRFLGDAGITVVPWTTLAPDSTSAGDGVLRFPVVVKVFPEDAAHKSEGGLLVLDVRDDEELAAAATDVRRRLGREAALLVQEMVPDGLEMLLAVIPDPDFGPLLALGAGGVLAEWADDIAYVQLPAARSEIGAALRRLKIWRLFQPFRGRPARDVDAMVTAAERLSVAYMRVGSRGWEIELNPVLVLDRGVLVADVLWSSQRQ